MQSIHRILTTLLPAFPKTKPCEYRAHLERDETHLALEIDAGGAPSPLKEEANIHVRHTFVDQHHRFREYVATFAVCRPRLQSLSDIQHAEDLGQIVPESDGLPLVYVLTGVKHREHRPFVFLWTRDGAPALSTLNMQLWRGFARKWDQVIDQQKWLMPPLPRRRPPEGHARRMTWTPDQC